MLLGQPGLCHLQAGLLSVGIPEPGLRSHLDCLERVCLLGMSSSFPKNSPQGILLTIYIFCLVCLFVSPEKASAISSVGKREMKGLRNNK